MLGRTPHRSPALFSIAGRLCCVTRFLSQLRAHFLKAAVLHPSRYPVIATVSKHAIIAR